MTIKMTSVENHTPHQVRVVIGDNEILFPPVGNVPCVSMIRRECGQMDLGRKNVQNIPVYTTMPGKVEGLPDERPGVLLIVSALVRTACPARRDLISPAEFVRDATGNITGCKSFDIGA